MKYKELETSNDKADKLRYIKYGVKFFQWFDNLPDYIWFPLFSLFSCCLGMFLGYFFAISKCGWHLW